LRVRGTDRHRAIECTAGYWRPCRPPSLRRQPLGV